MVVVNKVRQERLQKVVQSHSSQNSSSDTPESVLISISDVHFGRREREHDAYGHSQEESQEARAGAFDDLRFTKKISPECLHELQAHACCKWVSKLLPLSFTRT